MKKEVSSLPKVKRNEGGRPTLYTNDLAVQICNEIASHDRTLRDLVEKYEWFPSIDTIHAWCLLHETFSDLYYSARKKQADLRAHELDELERETIEYYIDDKGNKRIDPSSVHLAKLKSTNRQWTAGRLMPRIWGDKDKQIERHQETISKLTDIVTRLSAENKREY